MTKSELRHVIALLLEDVERLQKIEPNAGVKARIWLAKLAFNSQYADDGVSISP
ncbi:hypothetical protein [Pseudomonas fluorescens]|uniref:hypothetical protein n=1 Tax=Pseudomonas fluorescens TaxID=294 RepID=UPI00177E281B|nr:hypothetical protein [Pseudomonas fluorescens]